MDYFFNIIIYIIIYAILAQSYNLVLGYTGMVHVGHIAFMAVGAYTSSILARAGVPFWESGLAGIILAALVGFLLALPTVRFKEDYLVVATLGFGEIVRSVLLNWTSVTRGSLGLPGIPRPHILGLELENNLSYLVFVGMIGVLVFLFIYRLVHSPFGKTLECIREDEVAAKSLGIPTALRKIQILVIGAAFAGLSGVLFAHYITFIDPNSFSINLMATILLIVVFGGSGNFWGPIIGAAFLYGLFEGIRFFDLPSSVLGPLRWILYATIMIIILIFKPTGIMGKKLLRKRF